MSVRQAGLDQIMVGPACWSTCRRRTRSAIELVSTEDTARAALAQHPWNKGGGGAAEVQAMIEEDRPFEEEARFFAVAPGKLGAWTPPAPVRKPRAQLAGPVNKHGRWLGEKRFLMVPFHMIGARDVESAVLGGYADHVRRIHPGAPVPGFYPGERLFADARRLRAGIGDAAFFAQLNGGAAAGAGDGWGDLGADWDGAAFDAAVQESPQGEARQRLSATSSARSSVATPTSPRRAARRSSISTSGSRS